MNEEFKNWLEIQGYQTTVVDILANCKRVNNTYNLDKEYSKDQGKSLLKLFSYSAEDKRNNNPLKHSVYIGNGDNKYITDQLKSSVRKYMEFQKYRTESPHEPSDIKKNNFHMNSILSENEISEIQGDIQEIENDKKLSDDQKLILVKYRLGQSKYRNKLVEYWGGCSICGCVNTKILIASHIKPWNECDEKEKYDLFNGLLLTPNYDKLFDKHLITFANDGKIIISDLISEEDLEKLSISRDDCISSAKFSPKHMEYLDNHRHKFYSQGI